MELLSVIEIGTFTGLPAHPFFNRIAMYVVPTALVLGLLTLRPAWRRALAPWALGTAVAALVAVQLTMGAGEVMDNVIHRDSNPLVEDHEAWGKLLRIGLVGQLIACGWLLFRLRRERTDAEATTPRTPSRVGLVAASVVAVLSVANVGLTVMTAHSGSKSVYERDGEILRGERDAAAADLEGAGGRS
jgi:hypothetical protein